MNTPTDLFLTKSLRDNGSCGSKKSHVSANTIFNQKEG